MIEVKNRSPESWGPLADVSNERFNQILNQSRGSTQAAIKDEIKKQKQLKTYKVTFEKRYRSDQFEIQAESDGAISDAARAYFKEHGDKIWFEERARSKWAGEDVGYDSISYIKVK